MFDELRLTHHVLPIAPGTNSTLANDEVHLWQGGLDGTDAQVAAWVRLLSPDERARMARFRFEIHQRRYAAAHAQLRLILSPYLALAPTAIQFATTEFGKPYLVFPPSEGLVPQVASLLKPSEGYTTDICFNMSHAGDQMLVGVVRGRAIGVDIEQIRPDFATTDIAMHYFSAVEQAAFRAVPDEQKPQAFFNAWTRKEAFIKAVGEGLSFPLADFDVTLSPGEPARLLAVRGSAEEAARWQMADMKVGAGYAAAVVARRE